ncbi:hypothetical protein VB005_04564 [Metarhizium brunneum]
MQQNQPQLSPRSHHRTTRELPAWYRRLVILTITEDRDIEPWDFDEDISELGEDEGNESDSSDVECTCDDEDDCECYLLSDNKESEHSYTGSDADYYYELKEQRTDRKMQLQDEKEQQQEERNSTREDKRGDGPRPVLASIADKSFDLYSVDHVDYCYHDFYRSKYVEFYHIDEDEECCKPPDREAKITGHVYLSSDSGCQFVPFHSPKTAGCQKIPLKTQASECEPVFQFINNNYLIMTVKDKSRMISRDVRTTEAANIPDVFTFVGIHMDPKEQKRQILE